MFSPKTSTENGDQPHAVRLRFFVRETVYNLVYQNRFTGRAKHGIIGCLDTTNVKASPSTGCSPVRPCCNRQKGSSVMYFSNLFFLYIFLPALFLAYFIVRIYTYRRIVLTAFSLFFYAFGEPVYVISDSSSKPGIRFLSCSFRYSP